MGQPLRDAPIDLRSAVLGALRPLRRRLALRRALADSAVALRLTLCPAILWLVAQKLVPLPPQPLVVPALALAAAAAFGFGRLVIDPPSPDSAARAADRAAGTPELLLTAVDQGAGLPDTAMSRIFDAAARRAAARPPAIPALLPPALRQAAALLLPALLLAVTPARRPAGLPPHLSGFVTDAAKLALEDLDAAARTDPVRAEQAAILRELASAGRSAGDARRLIERLDGTLRNGPAAATPGRTAADLLRIDPHAAAEALESLAATPPGAGDRDALLAALADAGRRADPATAALMDRARGALGSGPGADAGAALSALAERLRGTDPDAARRRIRGLVIVARAGLPASPDDVPRSDRDAPAATRPGTTLTGPAAPAAPDADPGRREAFDPRYEAVVARYFRRDGPAR